jgi:chromosome segregation ATPase
MATLDQGVQNLQRFLAYLAEATSALGQVSQHVEQTAHGLEGLEKQAGEDGGGLTHSLEEAQAALDSGTAEATQSLTAVATAAGEGQQALGTAREQLDHAATGLEDKVHTALTDLAEADGSLTSDGFEALDHALGEAEQELQKELQETEQALNAMETAVQAMDTDAQSAWHDTEHELESAATELGECASKVEAEGTEGVHAFEAEATEMESRCTTLQGDLELVYDTMGTGVLAQAHEWEQGVHELVNDEVTFVTDGQKERLDDPASMLHEEALSALDGEYKALGAVLELASTAADELTPLADELVKSDSVVAEVGQLMDALAG